YGGVTGFTAYAQTIAAAKAFYAFFGEAYKACAMHFSHTSNYRYMSYVFMIENSIENNGPCAMNIHALRYHDDVLNIVHFVSFLISAACSIIRNRVVIFSFSSIQSSSSWVVVGL